MSVPILNFSPAFAACLQLTSDSGSYISYISYISRNKSFTHPGNK